MLIMIALGSDHGGFELKQAIKEFFTQHNIEFLDFGTHNLESVNYAGFALMVANSIKQGDCEKGILCCGTGIGISIAANKVRGIRAAVCTNEFCAEMCRRHNDANILFEIKVAAKYRHGYMAGSCSPDCHPWLASNRQHCAHHAQRDAGRYPSGLYPHVSFPRRAGARDYLSSCV